MDYNAILTYYISRNDSLLYCLLIRLLYYLPMERMSKEKESWTLLWVWTAYLPVKEIKWEFYVKASDFNRCMDGIRIEQQADRKHIEQLEEENKKLNIKVASLEWEIKWLNYTIEKLKEENQYREDIADVLPEWKGHIAEETIQDLQARIKELKERIDVLYEFIERNDKLVDEVIDEEDLDKLNRYIYIDDDLVDRTLESED